MYKPPNQRICKQCTLNVCEDEKHFMIDCPLYSHLRDLLIQFCNSVNPYFNLYNDDQKFIWLFSTEDYHTITKVAEYIYKAMQIRKDM